MRRLRPGIGRAQLCAIARHGVGVGVVDLDGVALPAGEPARLPIRAPAAITVGPDDSAATAPPFRDGWFQPADARRTTTEGASSWSGVPTR